MERLRSVPLPSLLQCPLCRGGLAEEEETFDCPECGTGYHPLCAQDLGGCATLGCSLKGVGLGEVRASAHGGASGLCIVEGCGRDLVLDTDEPGLCGNHSPEGMLTIALPSLFVSLGLVAVLVATRYWEHFPSWHGTPLGDIAAAAFIPMLALASGLLGLFGVVGSARLSLLRRRHRSVDGAKGGRGSL